MPKGSALAEVYKLGSPPKFPWKGESHGYTQGPQKGCSEPSLAKDPIILVKGPLTISQTKRLMYFSTSSLDMEAKRLKIPDGQNYTLKRFFLLQRADFFDDISRPTQE